MTRSELKTAPCAVGLTLAEKLIARSLGCDAVRPGELVTVDVDKVMIHDLFAPHVVQKFAEMGFRRVWDPERVVLVYDHLVPASTVDDTRHHRIGDAFARQQGITRVHRADGVCHQLMIESGHVSPGDIVFGTDSHTTTYGAVGAFSTGIGYTEMAAVLGTGRLWIKVPPSMRIRLTGHMPAGVDAKDLILTIIGDIGADGATYKALEFTGPASRGMSLSSRMTICNMGVEAGAKVALFAADERAYPTEPVDETALSELASDQDAVFDSVLGYDISELEPVVALDSRVDVVAKVRDVQGLNIDQAFLGSCTNGRLEDLEVAARILRGRRIAAHVRFIVTPASRSIMRAAIEQGIIRTLIEAGAIVTTPACGLCCGRAGGILSSGERIVSASNRNFVGRMGSAQAEILLASPATVAASALQGELCDPRHCLPG